MSPELIEKKINLERRKQRVEKLLSQINEEERALIRDEHVIKMQKLIGTTWHYGDIDNDNPNDQYAKITEINNENGCVFSFQFSLSTDDRFCVMKNEYICGRNETLSVIGWSSISNEMYDSAFLKFQDMLKSTINQAP